jgi:hypothetical protein
MASYPELKQLILSGAVKSFDDWFGFIEQKQFMADTGMSVRRLKALRHLPGEMSINELVKIGNLLDIDPGILGAIIQKEYKVRQQ